MTEVRLAKPGDAKEILEIYTPYILHSATSFETEIPSLEEMQNRVDACLQKFPWIVCSLNGEIAGYVYASRHREREAYQWSCECSVYVKDSFKGKGIGKILYSILFQVLKLQGFRNVYAGITLPNEASVHLHEKCGFQHFASYKNIGYKFGKWHTVGWWKFQINEYDLTPPPPLKISEISPLNLSDLFQETAREIRSKLY